MSTLATAPSETEIRAHLKGHLPHDAVAVLSTGSGVIAARIIEVIEYQPTGAVLCWVLVGPVEQGARKAVLFADTVNIYPND